MSKTGVQLVKGLRDSRLIQAVRAALQPERPFKFTEAQAYEKKSASRTIRRHFREVYESWDRARAEGSLWQSADDQWFLGNTALWEPFLGHVRTRKCLEIGSGPFGYLAPCYWIADRVIIDPLVDFYREQELALCGKTFFDNGVMTYNRPAEVLIEELRAKVDGFIVCQNALDHTEDFLAIMNNISEYAAPGCYLLVWTDIWHLKGLDAGHHNITKSSSAFDKLLRGLGFEILQVGRNIRQPDDYLEYGRLARKLGS